MADNGTLSPCITLLPCPELPPLVPPLGPPGELHPPLVPRAGLLPLLPVPPLAFMRCASALTLIISCLLRAFSRVCGLAKKYAEAREAESYSRSRLCKRVGMVWWQPRLPWWGLIF
jgi:hypothetical protein